MVVPSNMTAMIKVKLTVAERVTDMARTRHYSKLKTFSGGNAGVNQIPTDCVSVSGGLPGVVCAHMLEKSTDGVQAMRKYLARKCRVSNKRGEMH
jgi:hypothetical protein